MEPPHAEPNAGAPRRTRKADRTQPLDQWSRTIDLVRFARNDSLTTFGGPAGALRRQSVGERVSKAGGVPHRPTPEVIDFGGFKMRGEQLGSKSAGEQFELLTAEELAERLRVPASWVREQTRSRALEGDPLPHLRLGRYVRFRWGSQELEAWLRRRLFARSLREGTPVC